MVMICRDSFTVRLRDLSIVSCFFVDIRCTIEKVMLGGRVQLDYVCVE